MNTQEGRGAAKSGCALFVMLIVAYLISLLGAAKLFGQANAGISAVPVISTEYVFDVPVSTDLKLPYATGLHAGARGISGPHDLDGDGKMEVLVTDYSGGGRVHVIENVGIDSWAHVYSTPWWDSTYTDVNARAAGGGDMDGDGKGEIYLFAGNGYSPSNPNIGQLPVAMYVYEFTGTDNDFGSTPASTYVLPYTPSGWRLEVITIEDIDNDGDEELLFGNSAAADANDNWYILSVDGDIGSGSETWNIEVRLSTRSTEAFDPVDRGGGSPFAIVPADLDGDGATDLSLHSYEYFNLTNGTVTGPDSYSFPGAAAPNRYYHVSGVDDYSLAGGVAIDIDANGDDEVFYPSHHTNAIILLNYVSGDDILQVTSANAMALPFADHGRLGMAAGNVVGDATPEILISAMYQAAEINAGLPAGYLRYVTFSGGHPGNVSNYQMWVTDVGQSFDADLFDRTVSDSLSSVSTISRNTPGLGAPFSPKLAYLGDADSDGRVEIALAFQGIHDSVTVTNRVWNGSSWDESETRSAVPVRPFLRIVSFPEIIGPSEICGVQTEIPTSECDALVALYDSTDGVHWTNKSGWGFTDTPCSWHGVTCSSGHASRVDLYNNSLAGSIPPSMGDLTGLEVLDLSANTLQGSIPASLGNCTDLDSLNLETNRLGGSIPASFGNLSSLRFLNLASNFPGLSGPIPATMGNLSSLEWLDLSFNALTDTIPASLGNLSNLKVLRLFYNNLTGSIPASLGNLTNLIGLSLRFNQLSGTIPDTLGNLVNLTYLGLGPNNLSGKIPASLGNLTKLTNLNLSRNNLSGPIPPALGGLTKLLYFNLEENSLVETVPLPVAKSGAGRNCDFRDNDPSLCMPDTSPYQALAAGGQICHLALDPSCEPVVHVEAKALLEGPYSSGSMHARTAFTDHLPSTQPYSDAVFDGTALEYDTPDAVTTAPESALDWVLVSLRENVTPETTVSGSPRVAFLLEDGSIVDTSGAALAFPGVAPAGYYLVVRHRNHASVMSADTLDLSDGLGSWDFTTAMSQAYSAGGDPMKDLGDGRFGMFACDINADGLVTALDFAAWLAATTSGKTGYEQTDCNLDGIVTALDFVRWLANTTAGASSNVPD